MQVISIYDKILMSVSYTHLVYQDAADKLFSEQLLCLDESKKNLRLTDYGVDVSNYALAEFLLDH